MMLRRVTFRSAMVTVGVVCGCALLAAQSPQGFDPALLLKPPADVLDRLPLTTLSQRLLRAHERLFQHHDAWQRRTASNPGSKLSATEANSTQLRTARDG